MYFGRLSGSEVTNVPTTSGQIVGTTTELGVGFRIGIYYGENFGPLSGSLSLNIGALFEGLFAEIITPGSPTTTYYAIAATVEISGVLTGSLSFAIISASLEVELDASVNVQASSTTATVVSVSMSIDVELSASIRLVFTTITKSFSFQATLAESVTLSQAGPQALPPPAPPAGSERIPAYLAGSIMTPGAPSPPSNSSETIADYLTPLNFGKVSLIMFPIPVFSLAASGEAPEPVYVLDFMMVQSDFYQFVVYAMGWFALAYLKYNNANPETPSGFADIALSASDLADIQNDIAGINATIPNLENDLIFADIAFSVLNYSELASSTTLVSFPVFSNTVAGLFDASNGVNNVDRVVNNTIQGSLLQDYLLIVARSAFQYAASTSLVTGGASGTTFAISDLYSALQNAPPGVGLDAVAAMAERFLLHGVQIPGNDPPGLFAALGLVFNYQINFTILDMGSSPTFFIQNSTLSGYNLNNIQGFDIISVQNSARTPSFGDAALTLLAPIEPEPRYFTTSSVTTLSCPVPNPVTGLVRLPRSLATQIADTPNPITDFQLFAANDQSAPDTTPLTNFSLATVLNFSIQEDASPSAAQTNRWAFPISAAEGRSGALLLDLMSSLQSDSPPRVDTVLVVYQSQAGLAQGGASYMQIGTTEEAESVSLFVTNFSAQTIPGSEVQPQFASEAIESFLDGLCARSLTNGGGFFLLFQGLEESALPSFDSDGKARISVVVVYAPVLGTFSIAPYQNAIQLGYEANPPAMVAVSSPSLPGSRRKLPPGTVGLQLTATQSTEDLNFQATLDNLFHLVGFNVNLTLQGATTATLYNLPMTSPLSGGSPLTWTRRFNVFSDVQGIESPFRSFSNELSAQILTLPPPPAYDPFQLVGATVDITGSVAVDIYGNQVPLPSGSGYTQIIPWTDPLRPPRSWPGMTIGYSFSADGGTLVLNFNWTPLAGATAAQIKRQISVYQEVFYQLGHCEVVLTSSLYPAATALNGGSIAGALQSLVLSVLSNFAANQSAPAPWSDAISIPLAGEVLNATGLFPLTVQFTLSLPAATPVATNSTTDDFTVLDPVYADLYGGSGTAATINFAKNFESTFQANYFKLLAGQTDLPGNPSFWVLSYSPSAVNFSFAQAAANLAGSAPTPLATALQPRPTASGAVTGPVDCDRSLRKILDTIENLLAPDTIMGAEAACPGFTAHLLPFKTELAATLAGRVFGLVDGPQAPAGPGTPAAVAAYEQLALKSLTRYYTTDAVVEYALTVSQGSAPFTSSLALHGVLEYAGGDPNSKIVSLSPGSAIFNAPGSDSAPGTASMVFAVSAKELAIVDQATLPISFRIKAFQANLSAITLSFNQDLKGNNIQENFYTGTWLHFIIPPQTIPVPPVTLTIPMRAIPRNPAVVSQAYTQNAYPTTFTSLQPLKDWNLAATVRRRLVIQDRHDVCITINNQAAPADSEEPLSNLVSAIDNCEQTLAGNAALLGGALVNYNGATNTGTSTALANFTQDLGALLNALQALPIPGAAIQDPAAAYAYSINESDNADGSWSVTVSPLLSQPNTIQNIGNFAVAISGATAGAPTVQGNDYSYPYTDDQGNPLSPGLALATSDRTVSFSNVFDTIGMNSGAMYHRIVRNGAFAAPFVYQTDWVTAPNAVLPRIACDLAIEVANLGVTPTATLSEHLTNLLAAVATTPNTGNSGQQITIIAWAGEFVSDPNGSYPLPAGLAPVFFLPLTPLTCCAVGGAPPEAANLVPQLLASLQSWNNPSSADRDLAGFWNRSDSMVLFQIKYYATSQGPGDAPLLRLDNLVLPVTAITSVS